MNINNSLKSQKLRNAPQLRQMTLEERINSQMQQIHKQRNDYEVNEEAFLNGARQGAVQVDPGKQKDHPRKRGFKRFNFKESSSSAQSIGDRDAHIKDQLKQIEEATKKKSLGRFKQGDCQKSENRNLEQRLDTEIEEFLCSLPDDRKRQLRALLQIKQNHKSLEQSKNGQIDLKKEFGNIQIQNGAYWAVLINLINIIQQIIPLLNPKSKIQTIANSAYMVNSVICLALFILGYYYSKQRLIVFGYILVSLRQVLRMFDFEESRVEHTSQSWALILIWQAVCSQQLCLVLINQFCQIRFQPLISTIYLLTMLIGLIQGTATLDPKGKYPESATPYILVLPVCLVSLMIIKNQQMNLNALLAESEMQSPFSGVMDQLKQSIIIIQEEYDSGQALAGRVRYANDAFLELFQGFIDHGQGQGQQPPAEVERSAVGALGKIKGFFMCRRPRDGSNAENTGQELSNNTFLQRKVFKEIQSNIKIGNVPLGVGGHPANEPEEKMQEKQADTQYSLLDLIQQTKPTIHKVFMVEFNPNASQVGQKENTLIKYFQIRRSYQIIKNSKQTTIEFNEISDIIFQHSVNGPKTAFLEVSNACATRELRNLVDQNIAQNLLKAKLYENIEKIIRNGVISTNEGKMQSKEIMAKLQTSLKLQKFHANILRFFIQDLSDSASIGNGQFQKNLEEFNVRESIEQAVAVHRENAERQNIEVILTYKNLYAHYNPEQDNTQLIRKSNEDALYYSPIIITDRQRLMQVLVAISSNAFEFSHQNGQVEISVKILQDHGDRFLEVSVIDSGTGISYKDQEKLTKVFEHQQSQNTKGFGLSLRILRDIVESMSGHISFSSIPEQGSTITFTFKLASKEESTLPANTSLYTINQTKLVFKWKPDEQLQNNPLILQKQIVYVFNLNNTSVFRNRDGSIRLIGESLMQNQIYSGPAASGSRGQSRRDSGVVSIDDFSCNFSCSDREGALSQNLGLVRENQTQNLLQVNELQAQNIAVQDTEPIDNNQAEEQAETVVQKIKEQHQRFVHQRQQPQISSKALVAEKIPTKQVRFQSEILDTAGLLQIEKYTASKILIVNHQIDNIENFKTLLEHGARIDVSALCDQATSGNAAIKMIQENIQKNLDVDGKKFCNYDLIFMDCKMPLMDGYEAALKIRELFYKRAMVQPIITAIVDEVDQDNLDMAIESGINQVLSKPVDLDVLRNLCSQLQFY